MSANKGGALYVFEGPDGVGKSELAKRLAHAFIASSVDCELLAFPGHEPGTLGHLVYGLHHSPDRNGVQTLSATAMQAMHIAAHIDAIEARILPALKAGKTIVLDRYWWSTKVYGLVGGANAAVIEELVQAELLSWGAVKPSALFLIRRTRPLRNEPMREWRRWSNAYTRLAAAESDSYPISTIDNNGAIEEAFQAIIRITNSPVSARSRGPLPQASRPATAGRQIPIVFATPSPPKPTVAYETYWRFAAERQEIFFRRVDGFLPPWTKDPILAAHKFTNAYRASDRVSQFLIRRVIYEGDESPEEVFFRTILFKLFNKIETWELLVSKLGSIGYKEYAFERYDKILSDAMNRGHRIYSAAYIMPSGSVVFRTNRKHRAHLHLLERMMKDELPYRIVESRSMQQSFELLLSYPMIGNFLAYQFATDLNYSTLMNFSEMDFVMPGPGALNGIRKCFSSLGDLSESDIIKVVADRQQEEFARLGIHFRTLWGRHLQLIDCQNLFCEVDKYSRVKHPEIAGITQRTRIKQIFRITPSPIRYWYPPKWGINDRIPELASVIYAPLLC
ncbi:MAG: hypothetical protein D4S02_18210 [Rhodocyclaceae bacterium]|nr:MAG: hypothetical protein D4S02_18210 [Rhodocyclaceae bacterium]